MKKNQNILLKVRATIKRYGLIEKGDKVMVAVSGGPDSVAMLYLLHALSKELKMSIHVAHLDHMLRPDSGRDMDFVERLALKLKLPFSSAQINVKELSRQGSVEEIARGARLGFFFSLADKINADKISLGHSLDDQAETVLMRILRGTGLYGLIGILPKRDIEGHCVIRPLIEIRRRQIESFLRRKKIRPRIDVSNLKEIYFRNKIRNKLLPLLESQYNKNIKGVLSNMAESAGYDYEFLDLAAGRAAKRLGRRIALKSLMKLPRSMQRLVLRLNIMRLKGSMRRISFQHIKEIEDMVSSRPANSIVNLPMGLCAIKKKKHLVFRRKP